MSYKMVVVERDGGAGVITLNRPEKRNAFNMEMMGEIDRAFDEVARDRQVQAIVLTGRGQPSPPGSILTGRAPWIPRTCRPWRVR